MANRDSLGLRALLLFGGSEDDSKHAGGTL